MAVDQRVVGVAVAITRHDVRPPAAAPLVIQAEVDEDSIKPRRESCLTAETIGRLPDADESFLRHVSRVLRVAQQRPRQTIGPAPNAGARLLRGLVGLEFSAILSHVPAIVPEIATILSAIAPIVAQLARIRAPLFQIAPQIFAVLAYLLEVALHRVFVACLAISGKLAAVFAEVAAGAPGISCGLADVPAVLPHVLPILSHAVGPDVLRERRRRQERRRYTRHRERDREPHRFSPPLRDDCWELGRRPCCVAFTCRYIPRKWRTVKASSASPRSLATQLHPQGRGG